MAGFRNAPPPTVEGQCPTCPAEPLPARRSRCPICKEWISYVPDHKGHLVYVEYDLEGQHFAYWTKPSFKPAGLAFLGHMNVNAETHKGKPFIEAFYEPVKPATAAHVAEPVNRIDLSKRTWQAQCSCTWRGQLRLEADAKAVAHEDAAAHMTAWAVVKA